MGETDNIAQMAEKAFEEIFKVFGWSRVGPVNEQWDCIAKHKEASPKTGKHPTDAVYSYPEPYQPSTAFVNMDFKSYSKASLEKATLAGAVRRLANAVDCANKSIEFRNRYCADDPGEILGMLFIYNHDNDFDPARFTSVLGALAEDAKDVAKNRKMAIVGPDEIAYLGTVAADIERLQGTKDLLSLERRFVLPNLIERPARTNAALPLEALLGPWQLVRFSGVREHRPYSELHFYYRAAGTLRQFEYLFDYLFRYQLLDDVQSIRLRLPNGGEDAAVQLAHAKATFVARYYNMREIAEKLDKIRYVPLTRVIRNYSSQQIGMRDD